VIDIVYKYGDFPINVKASYHFQNTNELHLVMPDRLHILDDHIIITDRKYVIESFLRREIRKELINMKIEIFQKRSWGYFNHNYKTYPSLSFHGKYKFQSQIGDGRETGMILMKV
jgi:hypothetical protein